MEEIGAGVGAGVGGGVRAGVGAGAGKKIYVYKSTTYRRNLIIGT